MRRLPLLLTTLALAVPVRAEGGEEVRDKRSGLLVRLPDQWSRETAREKGSVKLAAIYDTSRSKYVLFSVQTGPSTGFDEASWLEREKGDASKFLKSVDIPWATEAVTVGGVRATRYTIGGKAENGGEMRLRGCGLVHSDVFFRILEVCYGGVQSDAADQINLMWEAVKFEAADPFASEDEEGCGEEEKPSGGDSGAETPKGEGQVIEDKAGNFKITAPPGWTLDRAPGEDDGNGLRVLMRREAGGSDVAFLEVQRIRVLRADFFEQNQASDAVEKALNDELKLFERWFEEGSSKQIRPKIEARAQLGKADKSCGFEVRGITLSEQAKIAEIEALHRRGDTSTPIPEYPEIVVRGRVAMISPYLYVTSAWTARNLSDDERLITEINQIQDSFEFESTEGMPPALEVGEGPLGNTLADPKNAEERKETTLHEYKKGAKVAAAMKFDYVLPPGFQMAERVKDPATGGVFAVGENLPFMVVAQDGNNGWVWIKVVAVSSKSLGSNEHFMEKKQVFETWISNFESKARGTGKLPKKPEKVKFGNLDGDGCEVEGKITGFTATEVNMVTDTSGWRVEIEMKTRGTGSKTFDDAIKTFRRKFRATKK